MNSKQLEEGNKTELITSKLFREHHYFVYLTPKRLGAQPVDIIALKQNNVWLIDAKHVRENECSFAFNRIEPNQIVSLSYASDFASLDKSKMGFAIYFERSEQLLFFPWVKYQEMQESGLKSVKMEELEKLGDVLDRYDTN